MSSRDEILAAVKKNQSGWRELPPLPDGAIGAGGADKATRFLSVLEGIGGGGLIVSGFGAIETILREQFPKERGYRIVTGCPELAGWAESPDPGADPHTLENVELAILRAHFGVAENGAC
ncbi:MAG TPA: hypothetical protein VNU70_02225, partial [Puia sp.]|nr:hypothetical protein [Puia sp.]